MSATPPRPKLQEYGMVCSMNRKGDCRDNALTESWFNSVQNERVQGERFATGAEMMAMTLEYIEMFYGRKWLHWTLGYNSPIPFLQDWLAAQQSEKAGSMKPTHWKTRNQGIYT